MPPIEHGGMAKAMLQAARTRSCGRAPTRVTRTPQHALGRSSALFVLAGENMRGSVRWCGQKRREQSEAATHTCGAYTIWTGRFWLGYPEAARSRAHTYLGVRQRPLTEHGGATGVALQTTRVGRAALATRWRRRPCSCASAHGCTGSPRQSMGVRGCTSASLDPRVRVRAGGEPELSGCTTPERDHKARPATDRRPGP
jgi:hypothetical protein